MSGMLGRRIVAIVECFFLETLFKMIHNYKQNQNHQILHEASAYFCLRLATGLYVDTSLKRCILRAVRVVIFKLKTNTYFIAT